MNIDSESCIIVFLADIDYLVKLLSSHWATLSPKNLWKYEQLRGMRPGPSCLLKKWVYFVDEPSSSLILVEIFCLKPYFSLHPRKIKFRFCIKKILYLTTWKNGTLKNEILGILNRIKANRNIYFHFSQILMLRSQSVLSMSS